MQSRELYPIPIVTRDINDSVEYVGNVYDKAGWVIHMLREQMGDDAFFRALQHYLEAYRLQNVVTADLAKAVEESSGTNVDQFFDQWIYGAGAPRFTVRSTYDDTAKKVSLSVKQMQKVEGHVGLFRVPIDVAITTSSGEKLFPIEVSKADETFSFPVDGPPLMVLFDKGDKILKSVDFQKTSEEWIRQLRTAPDVPDRADAAFALGNLRDNEAAANALGEAAQHDKFWGVREEALRALGRIDFAASAKKQVLAALSNDQPWVRAVAVDQLGKFMAMRKSPSACKTFTRMTKHIPCAARHCNPWLWTRPPTPSPPWKRRSQFLRRMMCCGARRFAPWARSGTIPLFPRSSNGPRRENRPRCGASPSGRWGAWT